VKLAIVSFVAAGMLGLVVGCQDQQKPAVSDAGSSALDVAPAPASPAAPVAYAPPVQTGSPDASEAGNTAAMSITSASNSYTIKPGDTLWKIAATHYGDGKKWKQILDANPGVTPDKLKIGQTITLP
jgi:5'-nucleotidase / UDP-sugar diphosphatase